MKALAVSPGTWEGLKRSTGNEGHGGLTFSLHIVAEIGRPHGLELRTSGGVKDVDALFFAVHDFSAMLDLHDTFRKLKLPLRRAERSERYPLVWAGGQGTFNPLPLADVADLVVLGDADESLPVLLGLWERHGNTLGFLSAAATVPGVFVPSLHNENEVRLVRGWSKDISIALGRGVASRQSRLEISRGCKSKCLFCGLGWMGPARHNSAAAILQSISGLSSVHLQACDAEQHPDIARIRERMAASGQKDTGCTSRIDSAHQQKHAFLYDKQFNFGIEGATEAGRKRIGKGALTNDAIVDAMLGFYDRHQRLEQPGKLVAWHMISDLPGESVADVAELAETLRSIDDGLASKVKGHGYLEVRWQPLFPQPGTPLQWCAAGGDPWTWSDALDRQTKRMRFLRLTHRSGRTGMRNALVTALVRSGRNGPVMIDDAAPSFSGFGELPLGAPMPWDFVDGYYSRELLEKAARKALLR